MYKSVFPPLDELRKSSNPRQKKELNKVHDNSQPFRVDHRYTSHLIYKYGHKIVSRSSYFSE